MPRALVTGGTGFIGSHVVRQLIARKWNVRCLVRESSNRANLAGLEVEYVIGDLRDRASLEMALRDCERLFHVAADYRLWSRHPEEMDRINVEGTRSLLEAAGDQGLKRIVFTSSVAAVGRAPVPATQVFGVSAGPGTTLLGKESLDPAPSQLVGRYKHSKFQADRLARDLAARGLPIVIVNPSAPIGSRDIKPTPTGKLIVDFLNGRMPAYMDTGMNFVDVEDVAVGHCLAADFGKPGERYILGNRNLTLKQFLDLLAKLSGRPSPKIRLPYAVAWIAGAVSTALSSLTGREPAIPLEGVRMAHAPMYYDASKAVRELQMPQTPVEEAARKAITWFKQNGYVR